MATTFSPELITALFGGLSLLMTGILGFAYKIWKDHNRLIRELNNKLVDITEKNVKSNEKLSTAVFKVSDSTQANTEATKAATEATKGTTDMLSKLMLELVRTSKK